MEKKLPKNWVEVQLFELLELFETGTRPKGGVQGILEGVPSLGGEHLNDSGGFKFYRIKFIPKDFASKMRRGKIKKNDILIVKDGATTGKVSLVDSSFPYELAYVNEHIFICRAYKNINHKSLFYYLYGPDGQYRILENFTGAAQGGINRKFASNTLVPLPPLPEQTRIVAKLDQLFKQLAQINESLDKIPQLLKDFRQQVLTQAVTGKLTKQWRLLNSESNTSLKEEKSANYYLHSIPNNWIYTTIGNIGKVKGGKRLPKGHNLISEDTGLPYIRARDLKQGTVLTENLMYLSPETQEKIKRYIVKENDLYITIVGAKIGDAGIIPYEMDGANLTENAAKITDFEKEIDHDYLSLWLQSSICFENIMQSIKSAAQGKLALTRIKDLPVYLGSIEEQKQIVAQVLSLFSKADAIDQQYQVLKQKIDTLPQAILHKAFKGELVPQLESDGDAKELLEEIKNLRKTINSKK